MLAFAFGIFLGIIIELVFYTIHDRLNVVGSIVIDDENKTVKLSTDENIASLKKGKAVFYINRK